MCLRGGYANVVEEVTCSHSCCKVDKSTGVIDLRIGLVHCGTSFVSLRTSDSFPARNDALERLCAVLTLAAQVLDRLW